MIVVDHKTYLFYKSPLRQSPGLRRAEDIHPSAVRARESCPWGGRGGGRSRYRREQRRGHRLFLFHCAVQRSKKASVTPIAALTRFVWQRGKGCQETDRRRGCRGPAHTPRLNLAQLLLARPPGTPSRFLTPVSARPGGCEVSSGSRVLPSPRRVPSSRRRAPSQRSGAGWWPRGLGS